MADRLILAGMIGGTIFSAGLAIDILILTRLIKKRCDLKRSLVHLRRRPWTWRDVSILLLALLAAHIAFAGWYALWGAPSGDEVGGYAILPMVVQILLFHTTAWLTLFWLMRKRGLSWRTAFDTPDMQWRSVGANMWRGLLFYLAAMPLIGSLAFVCNLLFKAFGYPMDPQGVVIMFMSPDCPSWMRVYLVVVAVLAAPIVEEVCFRGIALPILARHGRTTVAVLTVSLVFAVIHFHLPSLVPLFTIGVGFALAYIVTGSIVTSIVMHALFNGVSITLLILIRDVMFVGQCQ